MALLAKYVLKKMHEQLDIANIDNYVYIAPQDASTPFCTFFPYSVTTEYTFNQIIEGVKIQVSIFGNNADVEAILDIGSTIHGLFSDYSVSDGTSTIFCSHITNQNLQFLNKENFYQFVMEIEFKCVKNK